MLNADKVIGATVAEVMNRRADWLDDILAGLFINGIRKDAIEVQEHPGKDGTSGRTVVAVDGVPKYEFTMVIDQMRVPK